MDIVLVILSTLVLFVGIILLMAAKAKSVGKLAGVFIAIAAAGGLAFYGYGFAATTPDVPLAVIRTLLAVCGMYMGKNELGAISGAPGMDETWMQVLFQVVHLCAIYATVSTAIATVGAGPLRKLRLWLARRGKLTLIYGLNDESLNLGKALLAKKDGAVVFIDNKPDPASAAIIAKEGCVLRTDESALKAERKFMRFIGAHIKNRKIRIYALERDARENLQYAACALKSLQTLDAEPENLSLVIRGQENTATTELQVLSDRYGYGTVTVVQEAALTARLLVRNYPPSDSIAFDENARATEDYEALIVGFGQMGQAVLRQLVMSGQFEGSTFRAAVFAPDCDAVKGHFTRSFSDVLNTYDIRFYENDARSEALYDYLAQRGQRIKAVVLCTGADRVNNELADDLDDFMFMKGLRIPLYLCTTRGVKLFGRDGQMTVYHSIFQPDVLDLEALDGLAMKINHHYLGDPDCGAAKTWRECDYFSRMSCRAFADFVPTMLRMAGKPAEEVAKGWELTDAQWENMSRTEHLRWCAFHYAMGFAPMTPEEFDQRGQTYRAQVAAGEKPLRIGKDMERRVHACLVSWEELEDLSRREEAYTGKKVNYQKLDTENIRIIPKLLSQR